MSDLTKHLEKAEKHLQKGRRDAALREYLAVLEEQPTHETALLAAADLHVSAGSTREAVALLSRLLQHQLETGEDAKVPVTYKKLARLGTPRPEQSLACAQLLEKSADKSNRKEALEFYRLALLGFNKARAKAESLATVQAIVGLEPSADHYRQQGEIAESFGERAIAVAAFLQAAHIEAQNNADAAFAYLERAHGIEPSNSTASITYVRALLARHAASRQEKDVVTALEILRPLATGPAASSETRALYAEALIAAGEGVAAEPFVWDLFQRDPHRFDCLTYVIGALLDAEQTHTAVQLAQKLQKYQEHSDRRREYVTAIKAVAEKHANCVELLEYLVELFNASSREHDYCETLLKLFDLHYAAGNFIKAGESLDRAAEVDPYEPGHNKRLDLLRGKVDPNCIRVISSRLSSGTATEAVREPAEDIDKEPTILEDLMLQAEIFLQYSMRSRAVERLQRIAKIFPGEEVKNDKLRWLYVSAGLTPPMLPVSTVPAAGANADTAAPPASIPAAPLPRAVTDEAAVDNIAVVTEITRNIYRQGNVKSVLFTAINEAGRHWNASRCIAVLCTPGKPPSIALEYCAPGVKQSDVLAIVKLIGLLQPLIIAHGPLVISAEGTAPWLLPLRQFAATMQIDSMLAVPLVEGDEHIGLLLLAQCGARRNWRPTDIVVLKTIADQTVLAVGNVRLRSLVKNLAIADEKSGLLKRASYLDVLLSEVRRGVQQNVPLTLILMQFGKASELSRQIGEEAVESMMQRCGQIICSHIRQSDLAIRYDLTTLALVLGDTNDKQAFFAVDKLRKVLAGLRIPGSTTTAPITVGIAEAVMQPKYDPLDIVTEVINRAEAALDTALKEGGNKAQSLAPVFESAAQT